MRSTIMLAKPVAKADARPPKAKIAVVIMMVGIRPIRSARWPKPIAPMNWPKKPPEMSHPICSGVMCQACPITGRTSPIATVSTASKNVALPTMIRALRCQRDSGNASIRAATVAEASVAVATCSVAGIGTAPGVAISAIAFLPV